MPLSVAEFWEQCRAALPHLPREIPAAWAFCATPQQANELLDLVVSGKKTGVSAKEKALQTPRRQELEMKKSRIFTVALTFE